MEYALSRRFQLYAIKEFPESVFKLGIFEFSLILSIYLQKSFL